MQDLFAIMGGIMYRKIQMIWVGPDGNPVSSELARCLDNYLR